MTDITGVSLKNRSIDFPEGKKIFILDTNVLIIHPDAIFAFEDNTVIIPIVVVEEIDRIKNNAKEGSDRKYCARHVFRNLNSMRKVGSLESGIQMENGGMLYVVRNGYSWDDLPDGLEKSNDNIILLTALSLGKKNPNMEVTLISNDMGVLTKADAFGVKADDYLRGQAFQSADDIYTGLMDIALNNTFNIQRLYEYGEDKCIICADEDFCNEIKLENLSMNQCCYFLHSLLPIPELFIYKGAGRFLYVSREDLRKSRMESKVRPRNDEQRFAYALMMDPDIDIVSIGGCAGVGKTIMSLLAALEQDAAYPVIKIYRPTVEADDTLGFLPGTLAEKFAPWMLPIIDELDVILGKKCLASDDRRVNKPDFIPSHEFLKNGAITIEPLNYVRGRTLHSSFVIVDEVQNLTRGMVKLIVSRIGRGAKIILLGDITQIDREGLSAVSNGFAHLIRGFRGQPNFGHVTLLKSERSRVAEQASEYL